MSNYLPVENDARNAALLNPEPVATPIQFGWLNPEDPDDPVTVAIDIDAEMQEDPNVSNQVVNDYYLLNKINRNHISGHS